MGRPRKIRAEGQAVLEERVSEAEKAHALTPEPSDLEQIVDDFIERYPEEWEAIRLGPAQHALKEMARLLDG